MGIVPVDTQSLLRQHIDAELQRSIRALNPGGIATDRSQQVWGVDNTQFSPQEYVSYLATSNNVYVCNRLRAQLLAALPLKLYTLKANGDRKDVTSGALWQLTQKVNPFWTWTRLIEMTEMSLGTWGSSFWYVAKQGRTPRELWWVRSDRMKVVPHRERYLAGYIYEPIGGNEKIAFEPDEIIWIRYPNPIDEYNGLSPLAAARIAADISSAAAKSNRNLYVNGISLGGIITPTGEEAFGEDRAKELVDLLKHQAKGVERAHRWIVLNQDAKFQAMNMTPKDAEYLGSMQWNLEEIGRAYGIPQDLIGGKRTYENVDAAMKILWMHTLIPESRLLASEITEQLLPMFEGADRADLCEFDVSEVKALQDDEQAAWTIAEGQLRAGVKTINEYREAKGDKPVAWGEQVWWGSVALVPIKDAEIVEPESEEGENGEDTPKPEDEAIGGDRIAFSKDGRAALRSDHAQHGVENVRVAYASDEHERLWSRFVSRTEAHEEKVKRTTRKLLRAQEQSILTELGKVERSVRALPAIDELMGEIFSIQKWRRRFRETMKPTLGTVIADAGQEAIDSVTIGSLFDVSDPLVARFLFDQVQRFAVEVNDTTWKRLKAALAEGLDAGEGTDLLAKRVRAVMGDRIRSSAETIARTETIAAYSGARTEGFRQSGVVEGEQWLSALDERTRETHVAAHGQVVALGEDFTVGGSRGPGPGLLSAASESINCRCTTLAVLKPLA